jgi:starch phosphorylase
LASCHQSLIANDFAIAKKIAAWKEQVATGWDAIEVVVKDVPEVLFTNPKVAENYTMNFVIDTASINDQGIGLEFVATKIGKNNQEVLYDVKEFQLEKVEGSKMFFTLDYQMNMAGSFKFGFRMFPKNDLLPHRQDFCYVRWV